MKEVVLARIRSQLAGLGPSALSRVMEVATAVAESADADVYLRNVIDAITPLVRAEVEAQNAETQVLRRNTDAGEAWQRAVEQFGTPQSVN